MAMDGRDVDQAVAEVLRIRTPPAVLARLFPDTPDGDPVLTLTWATGRGDLAGRPRLTSWVVCAALD